MNRRLGMPLRAWLALVVVSTAVWAADGQPLVVAVTPLEVVFIDGAKVDAGGPAAKAMEDLIQAQLSDADQVTLVERARIDQVLKEQALTLSGLVDPATAARVGQLLKADVVVVGRVRPLDGKRRLATLRAVAVNDTRVLWTGEAQGDDAALAGQAASMGAALVIALRGGPGVAVAIGAIPLRAAKHHERAAGLRALGANEEAVAEELLALRHDPTLRDAEVGVLGALAAAGFERIAAAEAQAAIDRGGVADDSPLRALATRTAMPVASAVVDATDSLETRNLRRFISMMEPRVRTAPPESASEARKFEVRAWVMLGDAYAAERRDRKAREAYRQALTRVWALRASDPTCAYDRQLAFTRICDTAAARAIEYAAQEHSSTGFLSSALREALAKRQGLPLDAKPALMVLHDELPIADRVLLPGINDWCLLLLRVSRGNLPQGARLANAWIDGLKEGRANPNNIGVVNTRWVGTEATLVFARAGVAWPAEGSFGNNRDLGRQILVAGTHTMRDVLEECLGRGDRDYGFVIRNEINQRPSVFPELRIGVEYVLPPGVLPAGAKPTTWSLIRRAVHLLLGGDRSAALAELKLVERGTAAQQVDARHTPLDELLALCQETP